MEGKFIVVDGTQLYCFEKNPTASKTIFFIHGNSASSRTWRKQWDDPIFSSYRLVAFDLPAHGQSGTAADPESTYTLPGLGILAAKVISMLAQDKPYVVAGVSLATNIITEMLPFGVQPIGIVLAGPCIVGEGAPIEKLIKPDTHVSVVFADESPEDEVKSYGSETSHSTEEDLELFLDDFHKVKKPFRSSLGQSIAEKRYSDEIALLKQYGQPVLIVFGKNEKIINTDYLNEIGLPLWNNIIAQIEGASHLVNIDCPLVFNKLTSDYINDVFTKAGF
jgi:pimeloyl-ACP methyl ester carboxylesterase